MAGSSPAGDWRNFDGTLEPGIQCGGNRWNIGSKVQLWDYYGYGWQKFAISATDSGYFRISPSHATSSCLDVSEVSTADGALIHLWQWLGGTNQQWAIQPADGTCKLTAVHSGKAMDAYGAQVATPALPDDKQPEDDDIFDFSSGYIQRGKHLVHAHARPTPDIENLPHRTGHTGQPVGFHRVRHKGEVAGLFAVAVDDDRAIFQGRPDEFVKPHVRALSWPVDREVAQGHRGQPVVGMVETAQVLRRQLRDPVGRVWPAGGVLAHRQDGGVAVDRRRRGVHHALDLRFSGGKPGEKVQITWTDNHGDKRTDEATIA